MPSYEEWLSDAGFSLTKISLQKTIDYVIVNISDKWYNIHAKREPKSTKSQRDLILHIIKYTKTVSSDKVKRIVALESFSVFCFLKKIIMTYLYKK